MPLTFAERNKSQVQDCHRRHPLHRAWWSNNPSNNVMTKVWLAAGYLTEQVDVSARKLVFRRVRKFNKSEIWVFTCG